MFFFGHYPNIWPQPSFLPVNEVIVKLRTTEQAKRTLSSVRERNAERDIFTLLFEQNKIEEISPLFPSAERINLVNIRSNSPETESRAAMEDEEDPALSGLNIVRFVSPQEAADQVVSLSQSPLVEYAHLPAIRTFAAPDPQQNRQWGLRAIDYFGALSVPGYNNAKNIKIAILDSGIDPNHADLTGTFSVNVNFSTLGNNDDSGHGTHVAGIIAALTNNGKGITGVCASTELMILRGLTDPYQSTAYYNAIRYAFDNGAQILNCSLGGPHDPTEALLMRTAIARGVIVVAAMGNHYLAGNPMSYPAALPDVIAVGACDEVDRRASFSQTGPHISLVAPGTNILSTVPTYRVPLADGIDYEAWDGTSMATPFVSAAVALLLAKRPGASLADIKTALFDSAIKLNGHRSFTEEFGHGRLNLSEALRLI